MPVPTPPPPETETEERRDVDLTPVTPARSPSDRPPTDADVTDVLHLALDALHQAHRDTSATLLGAIERLQRENDETSELARALSVPPAEDDGERRRE
jgi:hypothetical protein